MTGGFFNSFLGVLNLARLIKIKKMPPSLAWFSP